MLTSRFQDDASLVSDHDSTDHTSHITHHTIEIGHLFPTIKMNADVNIPAVKVSTFCDSLPEPCKCGGIDHKRRSSHLCPQNIKRLKNQNAAPEGMVDKVSVVTSSLQSILRPHVNVSPVIQDVVYRMNRIMIEGSRFANGYLLWMLQNHQLPDFANLTVVRHMFVAVTAKDHNHLEDRNRHVSESVNQFAEEFYAPHMNEPYTDPRSLAQLITNVAVQFQTNAMNHVVKDFKSKLKQWLRYKIKKHTGFWYDNDDETTNLLIGRLLTYLESIHQDPPQPLPLNLADLDLNLGDNFPLFYDSLYHVLARTETKLRDEFAVIPPGGDPIFLKLDDQYIKQHWCKYLEPLRKILKTFVTRTEQLDAEHQEHGNEGPLRRGLKRFNLLPVYKFRFKHILIDTNALHDILRDANVNNIPDVPRSKAQFRNDANNWWNIVFNFDNLTTANRRFSYSLSTDGVNTSVHLQKRIPAETFVNDWGYDYNGQYHDMVFSDRVVGLDPGRRELFVAVDGPGPENVIRCSNGRWKELSGAAYSEKKIALWTEGDPVILNVPPSGAYTFDQFQTHWYYVLESLDYMIDFYLPLKWRKLRFDTRITRQKAYDKICNELIGNNPTTIIAYGGGRFDHASRGRFPTPNKHLFVQLKRRCRTRLTPEYNTSKLCSNCRHELTATDFYAVKRCELCLITWNRDVNAARNIREVFLYRNQNHGERIPEFRPG